MTRITGESMAKLEAEDANRDPITGASGSHPVGTGVGATSGAMAGTLIGAVAGPIGSAVGSVAGAIAGGLAGKNIAEKLDPSFEDSYWMANYRKQPYVETNAEFEIYRYAYRAGYEGRRQHPDKTFKEMEAELRAAYEKLELKTKLAWGQARLAARDAWHRLDEYFSSDTDTKDQ